mgnify:CR=1 FL=1
MDTHNVLPEVVSHMMMHLAQTSALHGSSTGCEMSSKHRGHSSLLRQDRLLFCASGGLGQTRTVYIRWSNYMYVSDQCAWPYSKLTGLMFRLPFASCFEVITYL